MDQTFDALFQNNEGSVVDDADYLTFDPLPDRILLGYEDPRILESLLVPQGDPFPFAIEAKNHHVNLVANLEVLGGMADAPPRDVGDMEEAVEAPEVHEHAVVGEVLDDAVDQLALFEGAHGLFLNLALLLLEDRLSRQNYVGTTAVERDDAGLDLLFEVVLEPPVRKEVNQRSWQKGADADVHRQPTLHAFQHLPANRLSGLVRLFDRAPRLELGRAVTRQTDAPLGLVHPLDEDLDLVIHLDLDLVGLGVGEF